MYVEGLGNVPKVAKLVSGKVETDAQICWLWVLY